MADTNANADIAEVVKTDEGEGVKPSEANDVDAVSAPATPSRTDDGLEERYNKLKSIAVKLKKKVAEQNGEIEELKEEKSKFRNASKIQQEFDKAQDEIEDLKKSMSMMQKDLQRTVDDNVRLKMAEAEANSQIHNLSSSHKTLREKLEVLEAETGDVTELKAKVESLEKELQEAKDARVDAQQEKRQLQILSLEVTDYEKKLQDAYGCLEIKKVENEKLNLELNSRDQKVKELEDVITNYKDSENSLVLAKASLQADVNRKAEKITFLQDEVSKLNERLTERKNELEKLGQDFENAKASFATQSRDLLEKLKCSGKVTSSLEQKISLLEEYKRSRESQITNLKLEMQQLESDYLNYKTKAQAMLKTQKPMTNNIESDEMEKLQKVVQDFHSEISILKSDLQLLKLENDNLVLERSDLNLQIGQLKSEITEKEVKMSDELQSLKSELRHKEELLENQKDSMTAEKDKLTISFMTEMENLKRDYGSQILFLREQCESLRSASQEEKSLPQENSDNSEELLPECNNPPNFSRTNFKPIGGPSPPSETRNEFRHAFEKVPHSQPLTIDTSSGLLNYDHDQLRMIPRGEGEGSESITSASVFTPRMDNYNVSFEQLLSTSFDSISISKNSDSEQDKTVREAVQSELVRCQTQVNHLTLLLRESESNCDRLAQLSEALKEEIRRIERDKERQGHLKENTEYLKNVLIKFMTLSGEAERQRLIPVLKTMLRLTAEEVERLECVAKGKDPRNREGAAGWSSYLPIWNSSGDK